MPSVAGGGAVAAQAALSFFPNYLLTHVMISRSFSKCAVDGGGGVDGGIKQVEQFLRS